MKRNGFLFTSVFLLLGIGFVGCNMNGTGGNYSPAPEMVTKVTDKIENKEPVVIYEYKTGTEYLSEGTTKSTSDSGMGYVLKVTPRSDGLLIEKSHPSTWTHNTIHVLNKTTGYENFRIDDVSEKTNTILYPFTKEDDVYEVWIEKQETNEKGDWQDWGQTNRIEVTAIGGLGNASVHFSKYNYDNKNHQITFKDLTFVRPNVVESGSYNATLFHDKPWNGPSCWAGDFFENKSQITIVNDNALEFIKDQEKVGINLNYNFYYSGFNYGSTLISDVIYFKGSESGKVLLLKGGQSIPNVYIEGSPYCPGGYLPTTWHFGDDWANATIRIEAEEDSLSKTPVLIKDRGNSTRWNAKVPYSLKFETKTKILGMSKSKRWVLMANYFDPSLIRTQFASFLGKNVFNSYWNAKFIPVNLYINGLFVGTYDLGECNKIEKNRVNIQSIEDFIKKDPEFTDVNNDGTINIEDSGFMVEIDTAINYGGTLGYENYKTDVGYDYSGAERIYFYSSEKCIPMTLKDPDLGDWTKFTGEDCKLAGDYAKSKIDAFEKMLYSSNFGTEYKKYMDETSFIDWFLVNEFGKNSDANFQKSVPIVYNASTKKLYMGPNWDFDLSLGNFGHGYETKDGGWDTVDNATGWYIWGGKKECNENDFARSIHGYVVETFWINRLMELPSFRKAVKTRWQAKKVDLKNAINEKIVEYANRIYDSIPANENILPRLGQYEWNSPSGYGSRTTYEDEITYLYNWCMQRYQWMDKQISAW